MSFRRAAKPLDRSRPPSFGTTRSGCNSFKSLHMCRCATTFDGSWWLRGSSGYAIQSGALSYFAGNALQRVVPRRLQVVVAERLAPVFYSSPGGVASLLTILAAVRCKDARPAPNLVQGLCTATLDHLRCVVALGIRLRPKHHLMMHLAPRFLATQL